jgi:hypothetical protein
MSRYFNPFLNFQKINYNKFTTLEKNEEMKNQMEIGVMDNNEDFQLREIQLNPRYEAGIGFFVTGDYERAIKSLTDFKIQLLEGNKYMNDDYLFLIKKIVSINKVNKQTNKNIELLEELRDISQIIYKDDFGALFENLEYAIINFNNIDPSLTIQFIDQLLKENAFPQLFEQIFLYYKASSYVLEGKSLDLGISILESLEKEIDDKYLKGCILNNKACAKWWFTFSKYFNSTENNKLSFDLMVNFANEMISIVKNFKEALIFIEEIPDLKFDDKFKYISSIVNNEENVNIIRLNYLKYILSSDFDLSKKLDSVFLTQMASNKSSLTSIKTSAIIFSNLGEFYFSIKEYKKSLILLNAANLFFQNFSNNDPLFFKNLSLVAMNNWKITNKSDNPIQMLDKILSQIKQFEPIYEKVFIFRIYGELLIEQNPQNILGNNLIEQANLMEEKISHFECRKIYLALPNDS